MKLPCKPKYVDEAVPDWCTARNADDTYAVVHSDDWLISVFRCLTKEEAETIVKIHAEFKANLHEYMDMK